MLSSLKVASSDEGNWLFTNALNEELSPANVEGDIETIKYLMKAVTGQTEHWNTIFLNILEPRINSMATSLFNMEKNVNVFQEKANNWDNFQLHISAWNAQLATIDRKVDIINEFQEKIISLENKVNTMTKVESKVNTVLEKLMHIEKIMNSLVKPEEERPNYLFGEFAARGILGTLKSLERKADQILLKNHNSFVKNSLNGDTKLSLKCTTPPVLEEMLNDISLKVNVLFKMGDQEEHDVNYENENFDDSQNRNESKSVSFEELLKQTKKHCLKNTLVAEKILGSCEAFTNVVLESNTESNNAHANLSSEVQRMSSLLEHLEKNMNQNNISINHMIQHKYKELKLYLGSHLNESRTSMNSLQSNNDSLETNFHHSSSTLSPLTTYTEAIEEEYEKESTLRIKVYNKTSCEELSDDYSDGIYLFANETDHINHEVRNIMGRFCEKRDDGFWTVIQRRDDYRSLQNFSLPWDSYKQGFGNLSKDFWFGNDFIHKLTTEKDMALRIELEDFERNMAWAEYFPFRVGSEEENYKLYLGKYSGNATDSFSGHNNSLFSTYDKKNDLAPECCPCAVSYEGGWWFNSCFESNLNGAYYRRPLNNEYRGIIWQHWLGDYSLRKSTMMIKPKNVLFSLENSVPSAHQDRSSPQIFPHYEEP